MDTERGKIRPEEEGGPSSSSLPGQLSCVQCRSRKLRCDRKQPSCDRCAKQKERCSYPSSKQRGLGRRKTVRELEERIEELESLLRNVDLNTMHETEPDLGQANELSLEDLNPFNMDHMPLQPEMPFEQLRATDPAIPAVPQGSPSQLIDLGLFEQLPSFELIDELTTLYFQNIHAGAPMLHQTSYIAALRLPPHMRPPMCLQYIVMAAAAATSEIYRHLSEPYYQRARVYAEADELKGQGETYTTVAHVQSWCLISAYECHVYAIFTRASTSLCRGVRIAQMLKLHQLDIHDPEQLHIGLPPPRNCFEAEERRRTWWVVFLADRYLTSITGWPSLIDERHIRTNLPSTEESFSVGADETPVPLSQGLRALEDGRVSQISPLATRILAANELLHTLDHTAHHWHDNGLSDISEEQYWQHHKQIDANLTTLTLFLSERLHLSRNPRSLDAILVHVCTNVATIQLHRTALGLMQHHSLDVELIDRSQAGLLPAADNIVAVFRAAGDGVGTAIRNPVLSFAAYMAASVFLETYFQGASQAMGGFGAQNRIQQSKDNLDFLAQILVFFGRSSSLVRANAFQLAADMQRAGYDTSMMDRVMNQFATSGGSALEIRIPGSKGLPIVFCPALTTTSTPSDPPSYSFPVDAGLGGYDVDSLPVSLQANFMPGPSAIGLGAAPSMLQAGSPSGLFSQLGANSGGFMPQI